MHILLLTIPGNTEQELARGLRARGFSFHLISLVLNRTPYQARSILLGKTFQAPLTPEQKQEIRELREQGVSHKAIARKLDVPLHKIKNFIYSRAEKKH